MKRVYQTKKPINADNDDRMQATESALSNVAEAMEALRGLWEYDYIFELLDDAFDRLEEEHTICENIAMDEQRKEEEGLTRDYWRMVP